MYTLINSWTFLRSLIETSNGSQMSHLLIPQCCVVFPLRNTKKHLPTPHRAAMTGQTKDSNNFQLSKPLNQLLLLREVEWGIFFTDGGGNWKTAVAPTQHPRLINAALLETQACSACWEHCSSSVVNIVYVTLGGKGESCDLYVSGTFWNF